MYTTTLLAAFAALAAAVPSPGHHGHHGKPYLTEGLNVISRRAGKQYFGTAADIPGTTEIDDKYYTAQLNNTADFGQLTPANAMKWGPTSDAPYVYNWTDADYFVGVAKANKQVIRCHNLVWYNELPDWISNGNWTNATLLNAVRDRVTQAITHFGDDCLQWDVVNEALNDDGTFREDIFWNVTGFSYIAVAFQTAEEVVKKHKLSTKLYYNDYNIEYPGNKSTSAQQNIVKVLQDRGIRIDGVGLQSHFIVGETPSYASQKANMLGFTDLGVDVAITELDIRTTVPPTNASELQQEVDYNTTAAACADVKKCIGITLWDFDDDYSWIPGVFTGYGYGTPWYGSNGTNSPLIRKIAYNGLVSGLQS